jgi:hypothetical protein
MTRGITINQELTLVTEACCNCGIVFAMPSSFHRQLLDSPGPKGKQFYCPNGHSQHYVGTSDAEKLKQARETAEFWKTRHRATKDQLDASERSKRAIKGHLTRTKKRIGKGVCPCCDRFFENVHNHMATEHPEYLEVQDE